MQLRTVGKNVLILFPASGKWKLASRAAVTTINGSVGGGVFAVIYAKILSRRYDKKLDVPIFASGILSGLVSITAISAICRPWEALLIGCIGGSISCYGRCNMDLSKRNRIELHLNRFLSFGIQVDHSQEACLFPYLVYL